MRVRAATEHDEEALRALDAATWSTDSHPGPAPGPGQRFFGPKCVPGDILVAVLDDALAGYVKLRPPTPLESNSHVLQVQGLAVDPSKRRRGVAQALLSAAAAEASARGARRLTLRVFSSNAAAQALYERCGFRTEGVLRGEFLLGGRYVDDILMALELTPRSSAAAPA